MNTTQDNNLAYWDDILLKLEESENEKLEWNFESALRISQSILYIDPTCVPALEEIADNYLSLDKTKESEKTAQFALDLDPNSYTANYILWFILSKKTDFKKSVEYLETANKLKPNNAEIIRCLWWSLFMSWDRDRWIVVLERANNLFPEDVMILCDLAVSYIDVWKITKATELLLKAQSIDPDDKRVLGSIDYIENLRKKKR